MTGPLRVSRDRLSGAPDELELVPDQFITHKFSEVEWPFVEIRGLTRNSLSRLPHHLQTLDGEVTWSKRVAQPNMTGLILTRLEYIMNKQWRHQ